MDALPWVIVTLVVLAGVALIIPLGVRARNRQKREAAEQVAAARRRAEQRRINREAQVLQARLSRRDRKTKVVVFGEDGEPVVVKQSYRKSDSRDADHSHYYHGGTWNGTYYPGGWYSDPFWNFIVFNELLHQDAHAPSSPDMGVTPSEPSGGTDYYTPEPTPVPTSTPSSSGSDWDSGSSSGYGSSSYDSGSSYSSYDGGSSGGGDSGGGGGGGD